jgi:hypothetical protein
MQSIMVDPDVGFTEILVIAVVDVNELLRVSVGQGKPAALHLYHDPVSF